MREVGSSDDEGVFLDPPLGGSRKTPEEERDPTDRTTPIRRPWEPVDPGPPARLTGARRKKEGREATRPARHGGPGGCETPRRA